MRLAFLNVRIFFAIMLPLAFACGDNLEAADAGGGGPPTIDAGPDDADATPIECEAPATAAPGSACSDDSDCDSADGAGDGLCLTGDVRGATWPSDGYCTRVCNPTDGSNCGDSPWVCHAGDGQEPICLPLCCDGIACSDGLRCSTREPGVGEVVEATVCLPGERKRDGVPCTTFGDCNRNSECVLDQAGTIGICTTVDCTVGDDDSCAQGPNADGHCIEDGVATRCIDPCQVDDDCFMSEGQQRCDDSDAELGGYCRHAVVGDTCLIDADCGAPPWDCKTEADDDWTEGYCTFACTEGPGGVCPDGTVCNDEFLGVDDPFCVEGCELLPSDTCPREGYACQDVNAAGGVSNIDLGCTPAAF